MRGVRMNLVDVHLIADAIHRGAGQIIPAARRVFYGAELVSAPRLQEPMFLCQIQAPQDEIGNIYACLSQRRAEIVDEEPIMGSPLVNLKAYLPVGESFGFTQFLRASTSGKAFPTCVFDHWQTIAADPLEPESKAAKIVTEIRLRKGLKQGVPTLDHFIDKL